MTAEWVTIGQVLKPHGTQGLVKVYPLTDVPQRFVGLNQVWLEWPNGRREEVQVEQWQSVHGAQLMKVQAVEDPETAESLRGAYIQVRRSDAAPLPEGQYYVFEMIGLQVVTKNGEEVGSIRNVLSLPANDVYVVHGPYGEVLIPAVRDVVVSIEMAAKRMIIRPIPGLLDNERSHV